MSPLSHLPQEHSPLNDSSNSNTRKKSKWKDRDCKECGETISNTKARVCEKCRKARLQARWKREGARRDSTAATCAYYCRKCNTQKTETDFGRKLNGGRLKTCRKCLDNDRRNTGIKKNALGQYQGNNGSSLAQHNFEPSTGPVQEERHGDPVEVDQLLFGPSLEEHSSEPTAIGPLLTELAQEGGHGEATKISHVTTSLRETLFARSCDPLRKLVQEMRHVLTTMFNEDDSCQAGYREFLHHFDAPSSQGAGLLARMATFHPGYFTHKMGDQVLIGDFEITNKNDTGGCLVLYATLEQLKAAQAGQGIPDVSYIVVAETPASECSDRIDKFLKQLERTFRDCEVEHQQYLQSETDTLPTKRMLVREVLEMAEKIKHAPETGRPYYAGQPPFNFLNLSGDKLTDSFTRSKLVEILELDQLPHLTSRTRISQSKQNGSNDLDKAAYSTDSVVDGNSCGQFELLGFPGTISSWHMDVIGMTWVQALSDHKAWCVVDTLDTEELWDEWKEQAEEWKPKLGTVKVIPLSAGDTLLMMPGKFTAHMPVSFGDFYTLMIGGQVWPRDPSYLKGLLRTLSFVIEHNDFVTNEPPPRQLPALIDSLREDIVLSLQREPSTVLFGSTTEYEQHHLDQLDQFKQRIKVYLSCQCPEGRCQPTSKQTKCACHSQFRDQVKHQGGCTAWCHQGACQGRKPPVNKRVKR